MSSIDVSLAAAVDAPSGATWDNLVLPVQCVQRLQEFASLATYRSKAESEWNDMFTGEGPIALFSGPTGAGKTFAAQVLANTLGIPLYRVDLGRLISKYIGETEKNLNALFEASTNKPLLLLFDVTDGCFGKRSGVEDTHDRYDNLGLNYLLSKLECYKGPAILKTNLKQRIDPAFVRRCHIVVDLPYPDEAAISRLWQLYLPETVLIDEEVNTEILARESELTGGQIRNAALHAAFLAVSESSAITSRHITSAIQRELAKTGD